jgi:predicted alpha/beta-hydrolase family hydrolase
LKSPDELIIALEAGATTTALVYPAQGGPAVAALILAHGAGAGHRSPFIVNFARALSAAGLDIVTFNFLYTEQRRKLPDRAPLLEACYRAAIHVVGRELPSAGRALFVGGKSMGGRIATQVAAADPALRLGGLVLLGYPLHPPGRTDKLRDEHLPAVARPMLFVQGSRDAFGTPAELEPVAQRMSPPPTFYVVAGGDHSFKVSGGDSSRQAAVYGEIQRAIVEWINERS